MTNIGRNLSLRELRYFCVAAETGSFRKAAERLFITPSAISHQIRSLEEALGERLFERGVRTLSLTPNGRSLYTDLEPLLGDLDALLERHRRGSTRAALKISVQPFFASELFMPRLPGFREHHPDIDLLIDTSDETSTRHPANADASIRVFRRRPENLDSRLLFPLRLVPVATREFRDAMVVRNDRVDSDFPVIVHASRPKAWQQWQRSSGIAIPGDSPAVQADSMIAVARAAERGLGAALVPVQLIDGWLRSGSLVRLFEHELPTEDGYYFVCRSADSGDGNIRLLRDWVLQEFGGTPE